MSREGDGPADLDLVATHYAGKKQHLRPIYDAIIKHVAAFGKDVELSPKKAYVSLRRNKQFACVGPATNTAIEVGLNLTGTQTTDRLQKATGMVSHRVRIESPKDVDKQLVGWLRDAYERG